MPKSRYFAQNSDSKKFSLFRYMKITHSVVGQLQKEEYKAVLKEIKVLQELFHEYDA